MQKVHVSLLHNAAELKHTTEAISVTLEYPQDGGRFVRAFVKITTLPTELNGVLQFVCYWVCKVQCRYT